MMRFRTGRHNGHTIYLQTGEDPEKDDVFVGSTTASGWATVLVDYANEALDAERATAQSQADARAVDWVARQAATERYLAELKTRLATFDQMRERVGL
jgi:ADP-ribose pyrophosphatase YjhB (NUDIX family)